MTITSFLDAFIGPASTSTAGMGVNANPCFAANFAAFMGQQSHGGPANSTSNAQFR